MTSFAESERIESDPKDKLLSSLLQPKAKPSGKLIQVVGELEPSEDKAVNDNTFVKSDEGPTMMELMMEAQRKAQSEKEKLDAKTAEKGVKTFAGGFKKGFFGDSSGSKLSAKASVSKPSTSSASTSSASTSSVSSLMGNDIPTIIKKPASKDNSQIVKDVQTSLAEEENPTLAKLKSGDWVTPDLTEKFQSNTIISRGLQDPKCQAALQLMQKDPNEAKKRFGKDPDVDLFLREFGKLMSAHFESLGAATGASSSSSTGSKASVVEEVNAVQEIGPLHAEVINKAKDPVVKAQLSASDDNQVKQVLEDPELREMLMDTELQRILQECGDPLKFQQHMRNPIIAAKIKKLYQAGLVGTAK